MSHAKVLLAGFNNSDSTRIHHGTNTFVDDKLSFALALTWVVENVLLSFLDWAEQPRLQSLPYVVLNTDELSDIMILIITWTTTFTVILLLLSAVGFNPIGIGAGKPQLDRWALSEIFPLRADLFRDCCSGLSVLGLWRFHPSGRSLCYVNFHGHAGPSDAAPDGLLCNNSNHCHVHCMGLQC